MTVGVEALMKQAKTRWKFKDIIDLEYFLMPPENTGPAGTADSTDRTIFLDHIEPRIRDGEMAPDDRSALIRCWLENRRKLEKKDFTDGNVHLPGDIFEEAHRLLTLAFLIGGLLCGTGLAFSFLVYRGVAPLNVSTYLGTFVLMQVGLVALALLMFWLRRNIRLAGGRSVLYTLINALWRKLAVSVGEASKKTMGTGRWHRFQAAAGLIKGKKRVYGALFFWPLAIIAQVFGIGFNLGILGATLLRVFTSDLAFGWQSTVQFVPQIVHRIVQVIAIPWSWFLSPPVAYPTLEQIEGSRMVLKSGIYSLSTPDLVSWWPFLCLAVVVYGLFPRVVLLIAAVFLQSRALRLLNFDTAICDQLIVRMQTPSLRMQSREQAEAMGQPPAAETVGTASPQNDTAAADTGISEMPCVVLIPSDIYDQCEDRALQYFVYQTHGYRVWKKMEIELDMMEDRAVMAELAAVNWPEGQRPRIVFILEAWQPPIKETLDFLQAIRNHVGIAATIGIALIGRPFPDTVFTPVSRQDEAVWRRAITILGDPGLRLETLGGVHGG